MWGPPALTWAGSRVTGPVEKNGHESRLLFPSFHARLHHRHSASPQNPVTFPIYPPEHRKPIRTHVPSLCTADISDAQRLPPTCHTTQHGTTSNLCNQAQSRPAVQVLQIVNASGKSIAISHLLFLLTSPHIFFRGQGTVPGICFRLVQSGGTQALPCSLHFQTL